MIFDYEYISYVYTYLNLSKIFDFRTIRKKVISSVVLPKNQDISPLIVVGNQKSGNSDGANILAAFRRQLNPSQVIC